MKPAHVSRKCPAQLGQPQVVRIKSLATLQRIDRRLADEIRRDFVALAKPERQHVAAAHARIGDFTDAACVRFNAELCGGTTATNAGLHSSPSPEKDQ